MEKFDESQEKLKKYFKIIIERLTAFQQRF
jgi:hypothetical protein